MNKKLMNLSSDYYYPSDTEKSVLTAIQLLIEKPELYEQSKDPWGQVSADRVKELYKEKMDGHGRTGKSKENI